MLDASADMTSNIWPRLEMLVGDFPIRQMHERSPGFHAPIAREAAVVTDMPLEGNGCGPVSLLGNDDRCRMHNEAWRIDLCEPLSGNTLCIACAANHGGLTWRRPTVGKLSFQGSRRSSILLESDMRGLKGIRGFSPFVDASPACPPGRKFKAVGATCEKGLFAYVSTEGIEWELMGEILVITTGYSDSQNLFSSRFTETATPA